MIAIIKYNAGNSRSVFNALLRLGYESEVTDSPERIAAAEKIIFPGVGKANTAMKYLQEKGLDIILKSTTKPLLGICLGMQLLCRYSEEGNTKCLGVFNTEVKKLPDKMRVPHTGWNNFSSLSGNMFKNLTINDNMYYVHGYYADICSDTIAVCNYILPFSAALKKDNFYGTQFHPEKSASAGYIILKNFLEI